MTRVFLDANILFSAAWREDSALGALWSKPDVQLVTSYFALAEAQRNISLKKPTASERLSQLASQTEISSAVAALAENYGLPDKDCPILEAAAGSGCSILLTGDITHFGHLIGKEAAGVAIMTVSMFLLAHPLS